MQGQTVLGFGVLLGLREILRDGLLALLQHADPEALFLMEQRQDFRALINAYEDQHGVERDGRESVGGHAENRARFAFHRDYRDARGELAQCFAESSGCEGDCGHFQGF